MRITALDLSLTNKRFAEKYAGKAFLNDEGTRYLVTGYNKGYADNPLSNPGVIMSPEGIATKIPDYTGYGYVSVIVDETSKYHNAGGLYLALSWEYSPEIEPITPSADRVEAFEQDGPKAVARALLLGTMVAMVEENDTTPVTNPQ